MLWWLKNSFVYDFLGKRSYSQGGEDMILRQLVDDKSVGFYVDVGAFHPKVFSNTYYFYKKGWRGINVEPNKKMWRLFEASRKRDVSLNLGVGRKEEKRRYLSCGEPAVNKFDKRGKNKVSLWPLGKILEKYLPVDQEIDFLSVDVEGMEIEVLKSNDWSRFRPRFLIIEKRKGVRSLVFDKGYKLVGMTGLSLIFRRG